MKNAYEKELEQRIERLETRLEFLKKELEAHEEHAKLTGTLQSMREVLDDLREGDESAWEGLREKGEHLWGDVRVIMDKIVRQYGVGNWNQGLY